MKKKSFLLAVAMVVMLTGFAGCKKQNDEQNINNNEATNQIVEQDNQQNKQQEVVYPQIVKMEGTKQLGDIELSNIVITLEERNKCKLTANVKNTSDKDLAPTNVEIKVINEKGETEEIFGGIITELIWYEENTFTTYVLADITDAKDLEFSIIETNQ